MITDRSAIWEAAVTTDYDSLAPVYDWLVPEPLLTPEGSAAAFAELVAHLSPGARVLDCAAGTGQLAVGLAQHGLEVVACDASGGMVERTAALARRHGVALEARQCRWDELPRQGWAPFEVVFCVGNSLAHAAGRREALAGMRGVLADGGLLVLTSRNWERVRAAGSRVEIGDTLVERGGRRALVVYGWSIADAWSGPHAFEVVVAVLDDGGGVQRHGERFSFFPFSHEQLGADLRAAGLRPRASTYSDTADRYLVTADRAR